MAVHAQSTVEASSEGPDALLHTRELENIRTISVIFRANKSSLPIRSDQNTLHVIATSCSCVAKVILAANKDFALLTDNQSHHFDTRNDAFIDIDAAQQFFLGQLWNLLLSSLNLICETLIKIGEIFILLRFLSVFNLLDG